MLFFVRCWPCSILVFVECLYLIELSLKVHGTDSHYHYNVVCWPRSKSLAPGLERLHLLWINLKMWHLCRECSNVYRKDASLLAGHHLQWFSALVVKYKVFYFHTCTLFWDWLAGLHYDIQCQSCAVCQYWWAAHQGESLLNGLRQNGTVMSLFHGTEPVPTVLLARLVCNTAFCFELLL